MVELAGIEPATGEALEWISANRCDFRGEPASTRRGWRKKGRLDKSQLIPTWRWTGGFLMMVRSPPLRLRRSASPALDNSILTPDASYVL
jgi:hypothetical protein